MQISRRDVMAGLGAALASQGPAASAFGQAGSLERRYLKIVASRARYGRVCHLFGDSIMYGWALGRFPEGGEIDPASNATVGSGGRLASDHPLYAWRSIAAAMRQVAAENRLGRFGVGYAGSSLIPMIKSLVAVGTIRAGDWVVLEDAGLHGGDPLGYFRKMRQWRRAVVDNVAATCIMMTMFDYGPHGGDLPDAEFDRRYPVGGGRMLSANDAIRMAANSVYWHDAPPPGRTVLIDMNRQMDAWRTRSLRTHGIDPVHPDGIHPNCWGQWLMIREILAAMRGPDLATLTIEEPLRLARENWRFLGYGTRLPGWGPERAAACLRQVLGRS